MVMMNKNAADKTVDTKRFAEILDGKTSAINIITGEKLMLQNGVNVPGKTVAIFEVE
jgi:hypothetical protein